MALALKSNKIALLLMLIILTRTISEVMQTYVFGKANYIWALAFVSMIPFLVIPIIFFISKRDSIILTKYGTIFAYLGFLVIRTTYSNWYSLKCTLSEIIVWVCFIFTMEVCTKDDFTAQRLRSIMLFIGKAIIILGCFQLIYFMASKGPAGIYNLLNMRPVNGIFEHPSAYVICLFPFLLYFFKKRSYLWMIAALFTCVFTGTRAPFLALVSIIYIAFKAFYHKKLKGKDIIIALIIGLIVYSILISTNTVFDEYSDWDARGNFASLQWRISYWRNFLEFDDILNFLLGHGVGAADMHTGRINYTNEIRILPHNDYLRLYWDIGVVGLFIFANMLIRNMKLIYRSSDENNSFIVLTYLVIIFFYITDNFIYFTYPVLVYMFIAAFANKENVENTKKYENTSGK